MADIRINALATTAASTASDDFVAVDGSANGTRKLNAYSPTFGGNLTVSGGTITGGTSGMSLAAGGTNQNITLTPSGTGEIVVAKPTASGTRTFVTIAETGTASDTAQQILFKNTQQSWDQGALRSVRSASSNNFHLDFIPSTGGALNAASASARLTSTGNFLIGTTTDGGQKLQVSGNLGIGTNQWHFSLQDAKERLFYASNSTTVYRGWGSGVNHEFRTSGDAMILQMDNSQNATFGGNIKTAAPSGGTAATWRLGTVASVSPTSPNRTIEVEIGGTTYYIHAKTTND